MKIYLVIESTHGGANVLSAFRNEDSASAEVKRLEAVGKNDPECTCKCGYDYQESELDDAL